MSADYYEPDWEDLAYLDYQQEVFEIYRTEHDDITRELRDYDKHTDRELRDLSKEAKSLSRELRNEYRFDVASDSFDVDLDGETSIAVSRDGTPREEAPRHLTRKDKRRIKTECRRASRQLRQLGFLTKRGCSPRQVTGYEDRSFTTVVAAA